MEILLVILIVIECSSKGSFISSIMLSC